MRKASIFTMFVFLVAFSVNASAALITFTQTGTGSGSIGGTSFTDEFFTITATGDTSNLASLTLGTGWYIDLTSASILITDVGTLNFTTGTRYFVNNGYSIVGFSRAGGSGSDLLNGPTDSLFSTWDMLSSIGPITGNAYLLQWDLSPVNTDGGLLSFNSSGYFPSTFEAAISNPVPEPSTMLLLGSGLVGLLGYGRRRLKK